MNKTSQNRNNLSSQFFDDLIELMVSFGGQKLIGKFKHIKKLREQYLGEHWEDIDQSTKFKVFREIDFDYIISLLRSSTVFDYDQLVKLHFTLINICLKYGEYTKSKDSVQYLKKILDAESPGYMAEFYMCKAKLYLLTNETKLSEDNYGKALEFFKVSDNTEGMIKAYNNLGIISYEQKWDTSTGKEYFLKAKNLYEKSDRNISDDVKITIQMNLGIIEDIQGNSSDAYEIFDSLMDSSDDIPTEILYNISINKGQAAKNFDKLDLAIECLSYFNNNDLIQPSSRVDGLYNLLLAEVYVRKENFTKAQKHIIKAFKIYSRLHDRLVLADIYRVFGMLYRKQHSYQLAESQLKISLDLNDEFSHIRYLTETHYEFSLLSRDQGDARSRKTHLKNAISFARKMGAAKRVERLTAELDTLD